MYVIVYIFCTSLLYTLPVYLLASKWLTYTTIYICVTKIITITRKNNLYLHTSFETLQLYWYGSSKWHKLHDRYCTE